MLDAEDVFSFVHAVGEHCRTAFDDILDVRKVDVLLRIIGRTKEDAHVIEVLLMSESELFEVGQLLEMNTSEVVDGQTSDDVDGQRQHEY